MNNKRRRWVLTFLATAFVGLVAWALFFSPLVEGLFGERAVYAVDTFPLFAYLGLPLIMLASAAAGYLLPRGFWLWGVAVVLPRPPASTAMAAYKVFVGSFRPIDFWSVVLLEAFVFSVVFGAACILSAALGAGLRLLLDRATSRFRSAAKGRR